MVPKDRTRIERIAGRKRGGGSGMVWGGGRGRERAGMVLGRERGAGGGRISIAFSLASTAASLAVTTVSLTATTVSLASIAAFFASIIVSLASSSFELVDRTLSVSFEEEKGRESFRKPPWRKENDGKTSLPRRSCTPCSSTGAGGGKEQGDVVLQ